MTCPKCKSLKAKLMVAEEAIERSMLALDDWLNTYAPEFCNKDRVAQARSRISGYGTVGYIAEVQKQNREALSTIRGENRNGE